MFAVQADAVLRPIEHPPLPRACHCVHPQSDASDVMTSDGLIPAYYANGARASCTRGDVAELDCCAA